MMKGLMDRCMAREKLVDCLKERAKSTKTGLNELKTWREVQIKMLDVMKKALEELGKEGEISSLRIQVLRAKEDEKMEFRNFDEFLYKLDRCYADGFNECLR